MLEPTGLSDAAPPRAPRRPGAGGRAPHGVTELALRDGSRVWVRPIAPEDRRRIVEGLAALSPRSRYLRFHSAVERLTDDQLDYLVDVDHVDHEALVAVDPDADGHPGVGVARYIRLPGEPEVAEAAVTVLDAWQGLGVGTALVGLLEGCARQHGIRVFRNYVLAENEAMLSIFRQLDGRIEREEPGLFRVDVPVPATDRDQPRTPAGRWIASIAAADGMHLERWAYPLVWLARRVTAP
jgi:GNAT superfamily N-acetyltransferase